MPDTNARRGFLKSLFAGGAAVAVAPWAVTAAKAAPPKPLAKPNCLLAEQSEIWTLESGLALPVQRIEVRLDFVPAITWAVKDDEGRITRRMVIPRLSERELRVSAALQKAGHDGLYSRTQLKPKPGLTLADLDAERSIIVDSQGDTETPLADLLRQRMSDCHFAWAEQAPKWIPEPDKGHHKDGFVHEAKGAFVVIETPEETQYGIGVTQYTITSDAMFIQAPARALFG